MKSIIPIFFVAMACLSITVKAQSQFKITKTADGDISNALYSISFDTPANFTFDSNLTRENQLLAYIKENNTTTSKPRFIAIGYSTFKKGYSVIDDYIKNQIKNLKKKRIRFDSKVFKNVTLFDSEFPHTFILSNSAPNRNYSYHSYNLIIQAPDGFYSIKLFTQSIIAENDELFTSFIKSIKLHRK